MPPADLVRASTWAGLQRGDPVKVEGTRLRGATWSFVAHVATWSPGREWVEVVGGGAGTGRCADFSTRSTRPRPDPAVTLRWPKPPGFPWAEAALALEIPVLTTDRLILRPFVLEDLEALAVIHAKRHFGGFPCAAA